MGFSRTGQNSIKQNQALKSPRTRMKDNPYVPGAKTQRKFGLQNYQEIKKWRILKIRMKDFFQGLSSFLWS